MGKLTLGTVKLIAISFGGDRRFEGLLRLAGVLGLLGQCCRHEGRLGRRKMISWRKSAEEGSIYRVK